MSVQTYTPTCNQHVEVAHRQAPVDNHFFTTYLLEKGALSHLFLSPTAADVGEESIRQQSGSQSQTTAIGTLQKSVL